MQYASLRRVSATANPLRRASMQIITVGLAVGFTPDRATPRGRPPTMPVRERGACYGCIWHTQPTLRPSAVGCLQKRVVLGAEP
ncbi:hypothetical protein GCM10010493_32540 [Streptomyces lavendulae subsp. grasserius]